MNTTVTMKILIVVVALFAECVCVEWSANLADGATVYVCEGQGATLPWTIAASSGERVIDITWIFQGRSNQMIAIFSHDNFLPTPTYSQRVQFVPNAGISISHVTQGDAGNVTVEVNMDDGRGGHATHRHTVIIYVASVPTARIDATMEIRQQPRAVYDRQTSQYHVQLTCTSPGKQPPTAVIWATPTLQVLQSSNKDGDAFSLVLPNPVSGGNYTCRIPPDSPAATCLPRNDPILEGDTTYVDKMDARLTLLEAEQIALQKENENLKVENADLLHRVQTLETTASRRVSFDARLSMDQYFSTGHGIILDTVVTNQGNAYSATTGYFTAPYDGTYLFLATSGPYSGGYSYLDVVKEGQVICSIRTYWGSYSTNEMGTCHAAVHVSHGQRVWLKSMYSNSYFESDITSFSGYLVSSD